MRKMFLADSLEAREKAPDKPKPLQRKDSEGPPRETRGHPVTIRLLDLPLHEFYHMRKKQ